jgi:hypothetical protein
MLRYYFGICVEELREKTKYFRDDGPASEPNPEPGTSGVRKRNATHSTETLCTKLHTGIYRIIQQPFINLRICCVTINK